MPNRSDVTQTSSSRRSLVGRTAAASVMVVLAVRGAGIVAAQGIPASTPAAQGRDLVDAEWLMSRRGGSSLTVVALTPEEDFTKAHIPGAVQVDWPAFEVVDTSDASIADWRNSLEATLAHLGITTESDVVVYDSGTLFAARLWWVLRYLGHEEVLVLNGGLPAWRRAGFSVEAGRPSDGEVGTAAYQGVPQPDLLAQMDEVVASLDDRNVVFVDARTPEEYEKGHIPGAVNLNYPLNALPDPPRFWKPADELRAMYRQIGVTPDKRIIPYCSSGVRSAVTAFTLDMIGFDNVALYTGSWQEWGPDPDAPKTEGSNP